MNSHMLAVAFGVGCVGVIGYCVYFDKKRRADPEYKQKIRNRRKKAQLEEMELCDDSSCQAIKMPDADDFTEDKIGILVCAVLTAENPREVLEYIYQSVPRNVFNTVVRLALPVLYERLVA